MDIKKVEIEARLIISVQSEKTITDDEIQKAILLTEININSQSGFCLLDDNGTKAIYRCHIEE